MHQEDWEFYFSNVNGKIASIAVDLGLAKVAPVVSQPELLIVSVKMNSPRPDGLSSTDEFEALGAIEDQLVEVLTGRYDATHAGRITSDGTRTIYFYTEATEELETSVSEVMAAFPAYEYSFETKKDEDWSEYLDVLHPLPHQFQSIQNRKVIDTLQDHGDTLEKERPVDHWIFFRTETDRVAFLSKIKKLGFEIVTKDHDDTLGDLPYRLHLRRVNKVDHYSVDKYVLHLWELAREHNGEYDGWETSVETG